MKVLLTAPPKYLLSNDAEKIDLDASKKELIPSLAIYQLASILRENGHLIEVVDPTSSKVKYTDTDGFDLIRLTNLDFIDFAKTSPNFHKIQFPTIEEQINNVDVVCISTTSFEWFLANAMIERIKAVDTEIPIIVGGVHATFADEYILKSSKVDFAVRKEGEKTLPELLDAIENNRNLKEVLGLSYKNNGNIIKTEDRPPLTISEMDETPLPAFDLLPNNVYGKIDVESSRGCKFSCAFCSIPFKKFWRGLSPKIVQKRIEHALDYTKKLYGNQKAIYLIDDTFTADIKRSEQILENLVGVDFGDVRVAFEARVNDLLDSRIFELCKNIPLNLIQVGVESGYDEGLKKVRKGTTTRKVEKCASLAKQHGIRLTYGFIIGFPWESKEDCLKTVDFLYKVVSNYGGVAFVNWFHMLPGSYIWNNRYSYGINEELDFYDSLYMESKEVRLKLSSKLKEEDFIDIDKQIEQYKFLLMLNSNTEGYIQKTLPYCDTIKIFKFE